MLAAHIEGVPLREQVEQDAGPDDEHPGVPPELPRREVARRSVGVGLLDELAHLPGHPGDADGGAHLDVPEAGRGEGRLDADRHQASGARHVDRLAHRVVEDRQVADDVVGGEGSDDRVRVPTLEHGGRPADRGHRVPRGRLAQQLSIAQPRELLADRRLVDRPRDDDDPVADDGLARDLEAVVTESVSNAVRHAGGTRVTVTVIASGEAVTVEVKTADYPKCARSWRRVPDVGSDADYPDLSARDADAVRCAHAAASRPEKSRT